MICLLTPILLSGWLYVVPLCYDSPVYGWVDAEIVAQVG